MAMDASQTLNLVSQDRGDHFEALVRALGQLDYSVRVSNPAVIPDASQGHPSLYYLGKQGWPGEAMERLRAVAVEPSKMLAAEPGAFRWAEPTIRQSRDFVAWPCARSELKLRLERCYNGVGAPNVPAGFSKKLERCAPVQALGLIGNAPVFMDSLLTLRRFAECDAAVLIQGETGTGKELAARAIHQLSRRKDGPFAPVCCGALPDSLVEAELFGHAKGAFTDAQEARGGLVAQAELGTLFLDEVEALSAKGQATLLRFLESLEYRRVGGRRNRKADLRIIAAANEDLHVLARQGRFRSDLLYRLDVLSLMLPPLRRRIGDAELLAEHFLSSYAQRYQTGPLVLAPASRIWMAGYNWPGNVRELENLTHRAVVTATGPEVELRLTCEHGEDSDEDLPTQAFREAKQAAVASFERSYLLTLMREAKGNVTRAAHTAGKERRALGKLLKKHDIQPSNFQN